MPRPVQLRVNYRSDSAFLLRLCGAVAKDDRQSPEWRSTTEQMVRDLALRLLQADAAAQAGGQSPRQVKARK